MLVLRSVLYMPAANQRAIEKAKSLPTDAIIFDLEDAVAPDAKEAARSRAAAAVASGDYGDRVLTIRCNGLSTQWGGGDLAAAAGVAPHAVVVPKVDNADQVDRVAQALAASDAPDSTSIWAMIETPGALLNAPSIANHPRCSAFVLGTNDLAKELRAPLVPGRHNLVPHLARSVAAARAAGIVVLDGVFNDIADLDGFAAECRQGFELGFDGKTLIHPKQIEYCNSVWSPSESEIEHAKKVISAFAAAEAEGAGVVTVDGRMVENLHVENARRVLAVNAAILQRS
ncbi:MAG: CoA ester lyase [Acidimicrobiales bacterium]|nr:CoA ester lyase [Acidimicrobiales bacterium]